ncbi:glycine cleavage system protein GcvH [Alkaliphilus oremlandii]|uniref:Glycine cleavage system H protein n=1 Tax=Alkaliphilus oremlandii (strain OhILAs) TaxID=350688 RepID=GCSH_ALKOO|nr:glycine cleavage system protein GcvH [Alkaliphilus oremlandii]A8MEG5.1 RecName: Full=Glycine cleavage system H protein [Alkaliphilus oremlandii OhILAs]ABW17636.1 glycine cleavage system H protein [Alkaliphilus oremlandii OhILAs]
MKTVAGLLYSKDHEWVKVEGNEAYIGITDFAQHALGEIVFVELPEVDDEIAQGDAFSVVESVKAASDAYSPVSGKVLEVNEELDGAPELLNEDAFANWIIKVELTNPSELEGLLSDKEYAEFCEKEA